jgi:CheY-like chemotaxis protein
MAGSVFYVEDEPDDVFFMERAFQQCAPDCHLKVFSNGREALQFFSSGQKPVGPAEPGFVLLDVNLPGQSGIEILREIRAKPHLRALPVLMYSSSNQDVDITEAYKEGCSAYLIKPRTAEKLRELVNSVVSFWLRDNQYPPC